MTFFRVSMCVGLAVLFAGDAVVAQTVYESTSGGGKVYSDRPLPGGKPVDLKPVNVMESTPVPPPSPSPAPAAVEHGEFSALPKYRSFAVVFPEPGGSVVANGGTFEVRLAIDPPLQIARGHAFMLRLDGREVPGRHTATEMMIPPEFFGDVVPAGMQPHVIEAAVVDARGAVLTSTAPVSFQTRFANLLRHPRPLPKPPPKPPSRPQASPVDEKLERSERPPAERMRLK